MKRFTILGLCLALMLGVGISQVTRAGSSDSEEIKPYPKCKGPRRTIAVYRVKDGVNSSQSQNMLKAIQETLEYELQQCGCFAVLIANEDMDDAASEIAHGQSGMAKGTHGPQAGEQLSAQVIVQGIILEVAYTGGQSGGVKVPKKVGGGIGGGVGLSKQEAKVVIGVKMFDPESRQLLYNERAEGVFSKSTVAVAANVEGVKGGTKLDRETPLGDAAFRAVHDAVRIIIKKMNKMPWQAVVLKVDGNRVLIRGGKDDRLKAGMILDVYKPGEKIEDPETGEVLSEPAQKLGQVRVTEPRAKMSYCEIISGPVMKGFWVRYEKKKNNDEKDDE